MEALTELIQSNPGWWLAWGGFVLGGVFGMTVQATNFCAMGALTDLFVAADGRRFRAWLLAIAVAVAAVQGAAAAGLVDLAASYYLEPRLDWFGALAGGGLFGIGMVLAGGCASRNVVRCGSGDLRAGIVVVVVGVTGYMTASGIFAPTRAYLSGRLATPVADPRIAALVGADGGGAAAAVAALVVAALVIVCFADARFRRGPAYVCGGISIGLCVAAAFVLTGIAYDEFALAPLTPRGLSFVRPVGDSLYFLERYTAAPVPSFAVASVGGALAGGFVGAMVGGGLRLRGFADGADTARNLAGAVLMGFGGVSALGCTIGQGVSGLATLGAGSVLAFAGICAGGCLGLVLLERLSGSAA